MEKQSKILVTGAAGMLGSAIVAYLEDNGYQTILKPTRADLDLERSDDVYDYFLAHKPEFVISCAGEVGGILANMKRPVDFLENNLKINMNLISSAFAFDVAKFMFVGSSCIYPRNAVQPILEEYLLNGTLEKTNEPLAVAKIAVIKLCEAYNRQYGTKFITCMPTNLYGPNDNYHREDSHVLPALLRKVHEAKERGDATFTVWGTGKPLREFLYVDDCATAICMLMDSDLPDEVVNIGSGSEVSIAYLASTLKEVIGFEGDLVWDDSKPDGTPRKLLDSSKIFSIGWRSSIPLVSGIELTYEDFLKGKVRKGG